MTDEEREYAWLAEVARMEASRPGTDAVRVAFAAMKVLTDDERGEVMCWFCSGCFRYIGPGVTCHCMNDE